MKRTRGTLQYRVLRVFRRAGINADARGALVHGLHHTFATELADSDVGVYTLMKLLGHESMASAQRYVTAAGTETRTAAAQTSSTTSYKTVAHLASAPPTGGGARILRCVFRPGGPAPAGLRGEHLARRPVDSRRLLAPARPWRSGPVRARHAARIGPTGSRR
jgi:Phage integrase family